VCVCVCHVTPSGACAAALGVCLHLCAASARPAGAPPHADAGHVPPA